MRVLIVDDHDLFRTGLRTLLEDEDFEIREAASGEAAVATSRTFAPDVVVMDMNMPGMNGIETTRLVLRDRPEAAVLMLTVNAEDERVIDAVRAGAAGYMLKDAQLEEIVAGIRAAAGGHSAISPRVAGALIAEVRGSTPPPPPAAPPALSKRERQVITLLAAGHDNAEIGRRLYVSASTVKNHVSRLLEKLGADNRVQIVVYAIHHGLLDEDNSTST
jgi:DNA-binding NarL/FixJ family response regulator